MVSVSSLFVSMIFTTSLFHQHCAQKLTFPSVLTYEKKPNHVGNWSIEGIVKLTATDLIMFKPSLEVQTCSKMCTIDLSKCDPEAEVPPSPTTCYCKRISHDEVNVYIGALARPIQNGLMLQAAVPSRAAFEPITATRVIGRMTSLTDATVSFTNTPEDIQVGLTRTMTMRCDVIRSNGKPKLVRSLEIFRDGRERVAKVSISEKAKALADFYSLKVKGNVSEKTTELGYIELIWEKPLDKQIGMYECLVKAVNDDSRDITMTSILEVGVSAPTVDQLVNRISELEKDITTEITTRKSEKESSKTELSNAKESMTKQMNDIKESSRTEINQIKEAMTKLEKDKNASQAQNVHILNDLASLQSQVTESMSPRHVETGSARCENSTIWTKTTIGNYISFDHLVTIKFKKAYSKPPFVMQAISLLDLDHAQNTRTQLTIVKVDRYGFTAKCLTWNISHVYKMDFNWMSISQDE